MSSLPILHIAVFNCDTPVPNVYAERKLYSDIFETVLREALTKTPSLPELDLRFSAWDCVLLELPSEQDLKNIDGIIITGAAAAAYDRVPWIETLITYCQDLYINHPHVSLFGSCFGHQLLCHAIFSPLYTHEIVISSPKGHNVGIHPVTLSSPFNTHYGPVLSNALSPTTLRLQFIHRDHVILTPAQLQDQGFYSMGSSERCALQGVWKPGRVLTLQGHAEFDSFVNWETVRVFLGEGMGEGLEGKMELEGEDDAGWAAGVMLRFFLESKVIAGAVAVDERKEKVSVNEVEVEVDAIF